jgi:septum formation protein
VSEAALNAVGAYHVEGLGAQLFARIDGDRFAILGLPLIGLLECLRVQGVLLR